MKIPKRQPKKTKSEDNSFTYGVHDRIQVHAGAIRFQKLYDAHNLWKRYFVSAAIGVVMAFVTLFMLKNTGLYNSGLSGLLQGLSRLIYVGIAKNGSKNLADDLFNVFFWGLYLVANIPLLIFSWFKIGKTFTKLTFVFLVVTTVIGVGISFIPKIDDVFIFGNTIPFGPNNVFSVYGVYNLPFYFDGKTQYFNMQYDSVKSLELLLYGIVYGVICSVCYAVLYIIGGCSGGLDYVGVYYATNKHKSFGGTLTAINGLSLVIGVIIGSYIPGGYIDKVGWQWQFFFSSNLISSLLGVLVFGLLLNRTYPINKKVQVNVYGKNTEAIRDSLYKNKYQHTITLVDVEGGYSRTKYRSLLTICSYIELPKLINQMKKTDPEAFITITSIHGVEGKMSVYRQGSV